MTYSFMVLQGKSNYVRCQARPHSHLVRACESWHQNITKHREACRQHNKLTHLWAYNLHNPQIHLCLFEPSGKKRDLHKDTKGRSKESHRTALMWFQLDDTQVTHWNTDAQVGQSDLCHGERPSDLLQAPVSPQRGSSGAFNWAGVLGFWSDGSEGMPIRNKIWDQFPFPSTTVSTPLIPALSESFYTLISHRASRFVVLI